MDKTWPLTVVKLAQYGTGMFASFVHTEPLRVSVIGGLESWTGVLDWSTGLEHWSTGVLIGSGDEGCDFSACRVHTRSVSGFANTF